jgi:hypothetical protein
VTTQLQLINIIIIIIIIPLSITNKMQRYTVFFVAAEALHDSVGSSAHHQELNLYAQHLVYIKLACCYR